MSYLLGDKLYTNITRFNFFSLKFFFVEEVRWFFSVEFLKSAKLLSSENFKEHPKNGPQPSFPR